MVPCLRAVWLHKYDYEYVIRSYKVLDVAWVKGRTDIRLFSGSNCRARQVRSELQVHHSGRTRRRSKQLDTFLT